MIGQIGNADQTPMFFDMPSNYTVESKGAKQVRILSTGNEKNRITAMLCCMADGHKLDPFLIFKRKMLPSNVTFPKNVIVRVHPKGWMDTDLMINWIDSVWRKRPGADLGVCAMLVLDSFRCHISDRVKDKLAACHTDLVIIPGGMTSQLQPLDVCLNKPMNHYVRTAYNEWLIDGEHASDAGRAYEEGDARRLSKMDTRRLEGIPSGDGRPLLQKVRPLKRLGRQRGRLSVVYGQRKGAIVGL